MEDGIAANLAVARFSAKRANATTECPTSSTISTTVNTEKQTRSYLMRRFKEAGINPKTRFGQNFLIDLNLLRLLFESAQISGNDVVLEVGTGTGSLTALMAGVAARVISLEVDREMFQLAGEELANFDNVRLMRRDVLKNKNRFAPELEQAIDEELQSVGADAGFKLVANLPYNVATPIISNLLLVDRPPDSMTITIQKELADRLAAPPSTKDYGALSVWVQSQCQVEIVRIMPPSVFWPRPKVHSAIVQITLQPERRERIPDLVFFHSTLRALFLHRRKFLRSVTQSAFKHRLEKAKVDEALQEAGFAGDLRAEALSVEQLLHLVEVLRGRVSQPSDS